MGVGGILVSCFQTVRMEHFYDNLERWSLRIIPKGAAQFAS